MTDFLRDYGVHMIWLGAAYYWARRAYSMGRWSAADEASKLIKEQWPQILAADRTAQNMASNLAAAPMYAPVSWGEPTLLPGIFESALNRRWTVYYRESGDRPE